jgi:DNA replication protein DnaC
MSPTDEIVPILKKLRLSGVLQTLELRTRQAVEDNLAHPEFLYRVLLDEVERRDQKQLDLRLRRAAFETQKTVEDFDFAFNPDIPKSKIIDLATCHFVRRKEVVMLLGEAGVGKSHLAQAVGHRACLAGHSVLYTTANQLLTTLRAARADQSYDRKLLKYTTPDLLIVDDIGLRPLRDFEPEDIYEVIRQRYERGASIWTSNRSKDEWYSMFGDELLASAAMDRLLHHATVIEIEGESYRNPRPRGGAAAAREARGG